MVYRIKWAIISNMKVKICYDIEVKPTVKLSYCFLELSKWLEM